MTRTLSLASDDSIWAAASGDVVHDALHKMWNGEPGDFLIVSAVSQPQYYVQFVRNMTTRGERLRAEAVADRFLSPEDQVGAHGATELRYLGWNEPRPQRRFFGGRPGNWWREVVVDGDDKLRVVASWAVTTLAAAYGYGGNDLELRNQGSPPLTAAPSEPFRREAIPERVRNEIWRRDQGRCVECGSRERLEYDHIVPVAHGGANTARNIELRCETCNRRKADNI